MARLWGNPVTAKLCGSPAGAKCRTLEDGRKLGVHLMRHRDPMTTAAEAIRE
jgi:hypothetical protein